MNSRNHMKRQKSANFAKKKSLYISTLMRKSITKFGTTVIIEANKEVLNRAYLILNIMHLEKFLWFITID